MKVQLILLLVIFSTVYGKTAMASNSIECSNGSFTAVTLERNSQGQFEGNAAYGYQTSKIQECVENLQIGMISCEGRWTPKDELLKFTVIDLGDGFNDASLRLPKFIASGRTVKVPCIVK